MAARELHKVLYIQPFFTRVMMHDANIHYLQNRKKERHIVTIRYLQTKVGFLEFWVYLELLVYHNIRE
jgi:hypothetical protein